jgi:hypothetical protein
MYHLFEGNLILMLDIDHWSLIESDWELVRRLSASIAAESADIPRLIR